MTTIAKTRADDGHQLTPVTIVAHDIGGIGGMERQLEELAFRLADLGHEVLVIARASKLPSHPLIRAIRVPAPSRPFLIAYPWFFVMGTALVRRHRRGVVHVTGAIVANRVGLATVHFCHRALGIAAASRRSRRRSPAHIGNALLAHAFSRFGERWCYRPTRLTTIVGVSNGVSDEIRHFFTRLADHTITIPNAVDHDAFRPASPRERARIRGDLGVEEERCIALFVGSEWERKGLGAAIDAIARRPEWDLLVVGSGDQAAYEARAASCGAAERVRFAGRTQHTVPFYQGADAFLLPSTYEAFSLALLEAASCGLPLLTTRVSGAEDLMEDGVCGWFIRQEAGDVASRLGELSADQPRRIAMGAAAREASSRYSWDATARAYAALYERIAGGRDPVGVTA